VHFRHFAPEPNDYAVSRYLYEAKRHYAILDARLAEHPFMLGETYTIVDMAVWGWARMAPFIMGDDAWRYSVFLRLAAMLRPQWPKASPFAAA
jgi:GST-like protein